MAKKLHEVTLKVYVMAENERDAFNAATNIDVHHCFDDAEIFPAESVDSNWWEAVPFGGDDDRTCGEILSNKGKE